MSVTVGIVNYNYGRFLGDAISSALEADRVVVLDDCSTDGSEEVYSQYPVEVVSSSKNTGTARWALDWMRKNADTDWWTLLSADDALISGFSTALEPINADWVWGDLVLMDEHGRDRDVWEYPAFPRTWDGCIEYMRTRKTTYPTFIGGFFDTKWMKKVRIGDDSAFHGFEDIYWTWTILHKKPKLRYLHIPWVRHRRHPMQATFQEDRKSAMESFDKLVKGEL